jgi:hypothetical protein
MAEPQASRRLIKAHGPVLAGGLRKDFNKPELSLDELSVVTGGAKNIYDPVVQTVMNTFDATVKAAAAARKEFYRTYGRAYGTVQSLVTPQFKARHCFFGRRQSSAACSKRTRGCQAPSLHTGRLQR